MAEIGKTGGAAYTQQLQDVKDLVGEYREIMSSGLGEGSDVAPEVRQAFKTMFSDMGIDLAPSKMTMEQLETAEKKLSALLTLMEGAVAASQQGNKNNGDVNAEAMMSVTLRLPSGSSISIAELMIITATDQRKEAMQSRLNLRDNVKAMIEAQVGKLEDAAKEMKSAAMKVLVTGIISAAVQGIAAGVGMYGAMKTKDASMEQLANQKEAAKHGSKMPEITEVQINASKSAANANATQKAFEMGGGISQSAGQSERMKDEAKAKEDEAEATAHSAEAEQQRADADMEKEIFSQLAEVIKSIIQFIKEMKDAEVEQMAAVTKG